MARITHVKKAQQRYRTVPVLDEHGDPVRTPVMRRNGTQKVTKRGKPVFMSKTVADKSQPLPNLRCDFPGCDIDGREILPGTPYKHITPRSGPYGGRQRNRHAAHPNWHVWEYSSSLSARIAQIQHEATLGYDGWVDASDVSDTMSGVAEEIRALADEKSEGADNIEQGFGHETYQSEDLRQQAADLEGWADEVESVDVPDLPDPEEVECDYCGGTGKLEETVEADEETDPDEECPHCEGEGTVIPDEPTEEQMGEWREEALSVVEDVLGNSPI